ncbi:hypothetical protein ElyMa_002107200 [Elysia marginata]|uniref:Uncharacterized protein n=1 Tax=Elysia marginata TaxID=1093978 RepID=A0AAV4FFI4_9GAST|nr:hypothetical protein ElyMa_002107200 [Elysia marginata]
MVTFSLPSPNSASVQDSDIFLLSAVGQRGRIVSASDSRSRARMFDSHVTIALRKQFTLTFLSPPTCKMGTQLQAILEFVICACIWVLSGFRMYWSAGALVALFCGDTVLVTLRKEAKFHERD